MNEEMNNEVVNLEETETDVMNDDSSNLGPMVLGAGIALGSIAAIKLIGKGVKCARSFIKGRMAERKAEKDQESLEEFNNYDEVVQEIHEDMNED